MKPTSITMTLFGILTLTSCSESPEFQCRSSMDCGEDAYCLGGQCEHPEAVDLGKKTENLASIDTPSPSWTDIPSAPDAGLAASDSGTRPPSPCSNAIEPEPRLVIINEVLASVPSGDAGDANGDGIRDAYEDEFIEFVSVSDLPIDLARHMVFVDDKLVHVFEPTCLRGHEPLVLFGGGSPYLPNQSVEVITTDTRLNLRNSGATVRLVDPEGIQIVDEFSYGEVSGRSAVREPEVHGGDIVAHDGALFSPGRCRNGRNFTSGCVAVHAEQDMADGG